MARITQISNRGASLLSAVTTYSNFGDTRPNFNVTQSFTERTILSAGVLSNLYVYVSVNTIAVTPSLTVSSQKSTGAGTQTLSFTSTQTGVQEDLTHSDAIAVNDLWNIKYLIGTSGGNSLLASQGGFLFDSTSNNIINFHSLSGSNNQANASTTQYITYVGGAGNGFSATEDANLQHKFKTAGTVKNQNTMVSANSRNTQTDYRLRVAGADSGLITSYGNAVTGQQTDVTHTKAVVVGNLLNRSVTTGANAGTITSTVWGNEFETTDTTTQVANGNNAGVSAGVTTFSSYMGADNNNTEALCQTKTEVAGTYSLFEVYVTTNTITGASTITSRKNGGAGNASISIPGSGTFVAGWFEDTTHSDTVVVGGLVNWSIVGGAGGTTMTLGQLGSKFANRIANPVGSFFPFIL